MKRAKRTGNRRIFPAVEDGPDSLAYCITHDRVIAFWDFVRSGGRGTVCKPGVKRLHDTCVIAGPFKDRDAVEWWKLHIEVNQIEHEDAQVLQ